MATSSGNPSPEQIREGAERLRDDFLREHSNGKFDTRDISRIRNNIRLVEKFASHNRKHPENAVQHMVDSLSWRNSFGLNDIKFEDIDEDIWNTALTLMHGSDRNGHNIVIINISKHRKDSKKSLVLQRFIAYCLEMHQNAYPQKRICMMFDMSDAGLRNMDMELIKFIINCFKIYFPDLLEWLLIFNMPWILQAAWKVVQSWLSESGAAKVKFVTTESVQEYIAADNLLTKFGGEDPWEYKYEVEREVMFEILRKIEKNAQEDELTYGSDNALSEEEVMEDDVKEEEEEENQNSGDGDAIKGTSSLKQVRFSPGLPPSRQSRYGPEGDDVDLSFQPSNSDQNVLRRGSATTSGFRRRQISRLISLQEMPQVRPSKRVTNGRVTNGRVTNGSIPVSQKSLAKTTTVGDVLLSPSHELLFSGMKEESDIVGTLTLKNICDNPVAYKVKTTAPLQYRVRPNLAIIDPKSVAKVQVLLTQGFEINGQDKFLVQTYSFQDVTHIPKSDELISFWKALPVSAISEHKMRCRLLCHHPTRSVIKTTAKSEQQKFGQEQNHPQPPNMPIEVGSTPSSSNLDQMVQNVLDMNTKLSRSVIHLRRLNYTIILLLVFIILYLLLVL